MPTKLFDPLLYDLVDSKAKQATISVLEHKGIKTDSTETMDADIIAWHPFKHETEVKLCWSGSWPSQWRTVHIPHRKARIIKEGQRLFFWIWNCELSECWIVDGAILNDEMLSEVPNRILPHGELFYAVPIDQATLWKMEWLNQQ